MQSDSEQSTKLFGDGVMNLGSLIIDEHYKTPSSPDDRGAKEENKEGALEDEEDDDIVMLEDEYEEVIRDN